MPLRKGFTLLSMNFEGSLEGMLIGRYFYSLNYWHSNTAYWESNSILHFLVSCLFSPETSLSSGEKGYWILSNSKRQITWMIWNECFICFLKKYQLRLCIVNMLIKLLLNYNSQWSKWSIMFVWFIKCIDFLQMPKSSICNNSINP